MDLIGVSIGQFCLQLLVLAFPALGAGVSHMIIVKYDWLPWLKIPLDGDRTWRGRRLLGNNKTFRGVIVMVVFSILFCYILLVLTQISTAWREYTMLDFDRYSPWLYGVIYGLGYTLSELPNSFLKRRKDIVPGRRGNLVNVLMDHCDSTIGTLLVLYPFISVRLSIILLGSLFLVSLHFLVDFVLYLLKLREQPL